MTSKHNQKIKVFLNLIYIFFANLFGRKHEIDSKKYRKAIYQFLKFNDAEYQCQLISYVKVFKHKEKIILEIETHRPGLLIGKAGTFIDNLQKFVELETNQKIKIDLRENKTWFKLY
jgi:ribosomal protein S3